MSITKVLVTIPAYNEERSIAEAVGKLRSHCPECDCLVVNDGSTDATLERARKTGATVVDLRRNIGIGGTVQTGFKYAHRHGYDVMVQFDGDNQHPADQIGLLLDSMDRTGADIVIGSRFLKEAGFKTTRLRMPGVRLLARVLTFLTGTRLTDTTSGFRAFNRRAVALFARDYPQRYPEPEALLMAHKEGLRMAEVPVIMHERRTGTSSIGLITSFHYMFTVLLNLALGSLKYRKRSQPSC